MAGGAVRGDLGEGGDWRGLGVVGWGGVGWGGGEVGGWGEEHLAGGVGGQGRLGGRGAGALYNLGEWF